MRVKDWFLVAGIGLAGIGIMSTGAVIANPKAGTSIFYTIAGMGGFVSPATGILLAVGIILFLISFVIKD